MNTKAINLRRWARFACEMNAIREEYPEHAKEIDRAVFDVAQKLGNCEDPNCNCTMNFENFHAISNQSTVEEK